MVAETGTEGGHRAEWLAYIGTETRAAIRAGVPVEGICLYPIVNHPGWDNDRHCENGLLEKDFIGGQRGVHGPLAEEIARQQKLFAALFAGSPEVSSDRMTLTPGLQERA